MPQTTVKESWPLLIGEYEHSISVTDELNIVRKAYVRTLNANEMDFSFFPPAINALVKSGLSSKINAAQNFTNRYFPIVKVNFEPLLLSAKTWNDEDPNSRFYRIYQEISASASIKVEATKEIMIPVLEWGIPNVVEVGGYVKPSFSFSIALGINRYRISNQSVVDDNDKYINLEATGAVEAGVIAKNLIAEKYIHCELKAGAVVSVLGSYRYYINSNLPNSGKIEIGAVTLIGSFVIKSTCSDSGDSFCDFEMLNVNMNYKVCDGYEF